MADAERALPLFPLEQVVLYPGMGLPLRIFEERYKVMIGACHLTDQLFGVLLIRSGSEVGAPAEPERIGCTARITRVDRLPDGQMRVFCIGEQRFRLVGPARVMAEGYLVGDARMLSDEPTSPIPAELVREVKDEFGKYRAETLVGMEGSDALSPEAASDPVRLSYWVAARLHVHPRERQHLLALDLPGRLQEELNMLRRENRPFSIGPFSRN